jgi:ADP-ribose pyrophosphatase YjhB (NUDIX family)
MTRCDHTSVGVIIAQRGRYLLLTRARPPAGVAPPAGHIDQHGGPVEAALAEVAEEVGLRVTELCELVTGWRDNTCRRRPAGPVGHQWTVYRARGVTGRLRASRTETRGARWYTPAELVGLAERTAAYADGRLAEADWQSRPGIEPVWCQWLTRAGVLRLSRRELAAVDEVAAGRRPSGLAA